MYVKELATGKQLLSKPIPDTAGDAVWANDNKTLFYVTKDKLDRPYKVAGRRGPRPSGGSRQRADQAACRLKWRPCPGLEAHDREQCRRRQAGFP